MCNDYRNVAQLLLSCTIMTKYVVYVVRYHVPQNRKCHISNAQPTLNGIPINCNISKTFVEMPLKCMNIMAVGSILSVKPITGYLIQKLYWARESFTKTRALLWVTFLFEWILIPKKSKKSMCMSLRLLFFAPAKRSISPSMAVKWSDYLKYGFVMIEIQFGNIKEILIKYFIFNTKVA